MKRSSLIDKTDPAGFLLASLAWLSCSVAALGLDTNLPPCAGCAVAYPYASTNPLTSIAFNESEILRAFNTNLVSTQDTIKAWYNDERALVLGIRRVIVKTSTGSTTNDYPVTPLISNPGSFTNPAVGTLALSGDQAGTDITNRPMFPALFITDTTTDPASRAGDWQFGGTAIPPHAVFGSWKAAVRTVDKTKSPPAISIMNDSDPNANHWNLGNGDPAPPGLTDLGYGTEVRWNVAALGLLPGHSYRLYFMLHDGDQNRVGGDAGQGCVNITVVSAIGPQSRTNCPGDTVVFNTIVNSSGTYTFTWLKDGSLLAGQTNNMLTLTSITETNAGNYTVIVSSQCGSVTNSATLIVNKTVTASPIGNLVKCTGQSASFSTVAGGTGPFSYIWEKDDSVIFGQTGSSLTIPAVVATNAGKYSVIVGGACGRVTNSATLTVNPPPAISCSANKTVEAGSAWTFDAPTGNYPISVQGTVTNGAGQCTFTATRTWQVADPCGNTAQCSQTVTVVDTTAPVILCPGNLVFSANPGQCSRSNVTFAVTVSDNCGSANVVSVPASGSTFPVGVTVVTNTATDSHGNSSACTFTVTVNDTEKPQIICPANLVLSADPGQCSRGNVTFLVTASDNCGPVNVTSVPASGSTFPMGVTVVTNTATDSHGNSSVCTFTVTINDTEPPQIVCPANLALSADAGQCSRSNVTFAVTASDNCGPVTVTSVPASASTFPVGVTVVTNTATDSHGNSAVCTFTVTINDTEPPQIVCPANLVLSAEPGQCSRSNVTFLVTASDNCGPVNVTSIPASGSTFPVGVAIVTNTATDSHGNSTVCTFTVTINDTEPPQIGCPANLVLSADAGQCSRSNVTFAVTAADNCGPVTVTSVPPSGSIFPVGVTIVTNTATDSHGNSSVCTFPVTINDAEPPQIGCPANLVLSADAGQCSRSNVTFIVTATDNCGPVSVTSVPTSGTTFPIGMTVVTNTATDSHGNSSVCTFTVTINDTEPPHIVCVTNRTVEVGNPWTFDEPTFSDNCGTPVVTVSTITNLGCGHSLTATRTWRAIDASGNTAQCSQTVTVVDTTAPTVVITSPTNGTIFLAPARFQVMAEAEDVNGSVAKVEFFLGTTNVGEATNGSPYFIVLTNVPAGSYTLTAKAIDSCGNAATSPPVHITVLASVPLSVNGPIRLNFQTGFYEQKAHISNPTPFTLGAVGVLAYNMPTAWRLQNGSFVLNGVPGVLYNLPLAPGAGADVTLKYYLGPGSSTNASPNLVALEMQPSGITSVSGTPVPILRKLLLPDGSFLINFYTVNNVTYYVLYSEDMVNWKTSAQPVHGTGYSAQWIDYGPPATDSLPGSHSSRFYRVVSVP